MLRGRARVVKWDSSILTKVIIESKLKTFGYAAFLVKILLSHLLT